MVYFKRIALLSASGLALVIGTPAMGQDVPSASAAASATSGDTTGDIVVTAQHRAENVQKVPIAVTAISPERIERLNLRDLPALQQVTPGLQFNSGINYAQTFIRGVGYPNAAPGVETSVATYIDGAYLERGFGTIFDVLDPGSVQVLKGPQGTLWGRNATGGTILINTADPRLENSARVVGEVGNQGHWLGEAVANAKLGDTVALRISGRYREDGGYIRNLPDNSLLGDHQNWTVRGKLLFQPSSDLKAVAEIQLDHSTRSEGANAADLPAVYCAFCGGSTFKLPVTDPYTTVVNRLNGGVGGRDRSEFYNLNLTYSTGAVSLNSVTAYRRSVNFETGDFDFTEVPGFNIAQFSGSKAFTQDLTANITVSDRIQATTGVSYLHDNSYIFLDVFSGSTIPGPHALANQVTTESYSAFAEANVELAPKLKLTAGGRYTHDLRTAQTQRASFSNFTPRAVLAYEAGPLNLYASYNQGYKAGGFSTPAANPLNVYQPETIKNYEVGVKFLSADRRLRLNLAAFHYDQHNLQVLAVNQGNIANLSQTQNAAAKASGFELDGDFRPIEHVQLFGGLSHLNAHYTQFKGAVVSVPVFTNGVASGSASGTEDLSGFRVPQAPRWTAFLGMTLAAPLGRWNGELTGLVRHTTSFDFYPGAGGPLRADRQQAYTTAKLSGRLSSPNDRYAIGFFIENLTNEVYASFRFTTAPFGGLQYIARPRTFGLKLEAKFGN
jgi:iron complex outermembrane receptor protein